MDAIILTQAGTSVMRCGAFHKHTCGFTVRILLHSVCVKEYIAIILKVKEDEKKEDK